MNKTRFRLLVFFMSLSLIGIILVQLYWINISFKNGEDQFKSDVQRLMNKVSLKLENEEKENFYRLYIHIKDSVGHVPNQADFANYLYKGNIRERNNIIYSDIIAQSYKEELEFIDDSSFSKNNSLTENSGENGMTIDAVKQSMNNAKKENEKKESLKIQLLFDYYNEGRPIESRISEESLVRTLKAEMEESGIDTYFEYVVYKDGLATKMQSKGFSFKEGHYGITLFSGSSSVGDKPDYRLMVSFPNKQKYILTKLLGITSLSIVFTLIIIIAYLSAINQLIKQKQISEIKTDFINNMTHEFKTPIATINLALDAIKNPKILGDTEKVQRYLQMIREENKRMHSQVENVLQISKLDRKELDLTKDQADIHDIIEDAIEHVHLIIEAREGQLTRHFHATRTTVLLNDVHFTNVIVNILDNAIKYSEGEPEIDVYTENVKDFVLIKITDKGLGMSKTTQKRIFEKFYREHTGDLHNVKGHGLGLAYVKRIIDDHNCHIYVESEKGKGSTFIIKMPLIN
ncbi:HAMP domain-containing sensor histidine kinase [Flavobacterium sp. ST-75]|uniref:histidine kinase n=1 Tax=Flavobacterium rhizophilum TaxID=3163296 RepID=A0ABW8Y9I3_9FLAO